jgi:hypothetical protein
VIEYVTVIPASKGRNGWMASAKQGSSFKQTRLESRDPEALRAEAERMYPGVWVVMPGDEETPWTQ